MDKKYCQICGALALCVVVGGYIICNKCQAKECNQPDAPGFSYDHEIAQHPYGIPATTETTFTSTTTLPPR